VRCNPEIIDELRAQYPAITKHKYFSAKFWNLVYMDNTIPDKLISEWISISYDLTITNLTKKVRTELNL
jgi:predicted DNA-binding protein (MmcQ/YjbR family)